MKKTFASGMLLMLSILVHDAQPLYSKENLAQSSPEDLELYLDKSLGLKKTGSILSISGAASALTGFILAGAGESTFPLGFGMLLAGSGVTLVGLPVLITGSSRVKRVRTRMAIGQETALMEALPAWYYNHNTSKSQLGIGLIMSL